ncbi:MAG: hypothetical protein Fues2KO_52720 [Fuerstiella sp.]
MKSPIARTGAALVCLVASFATAELTHAADQAARSVFQQSLNPSVVFRAQSGDVPVPQDAGAGAAAGAGVSGGVGTESFSIPSDGLTGPEVSTWNAFSPPIAADPFAPTPGYAPGAAPYAPYQPYSGAGPMVSPYGSQQPFAVQGANSMQPYQPGWHPRLEIEWLPSTDVNPSANGDLEQFGVNYDLAYTGPFMPGWIVTWTNQFRLRNWDGPQAGPGLPGKAFRFGVDLEVETPHAGPFAMSFAVTPSLNTDFDQSPGSSSFQLDGRGMFIFQLDRAWSMVLGAGYWDRVNDRVIPYAGFVYRDEYWEWRILYPESTISLFLGNGATGASWMYIRAEYNVEAFEVRTAAGIDEVELEDYRATLGLRTDTGMSSWFIEGGWVFEREVEYATSTASFRPQTGFIARTGWRY